eukprot:g516.t1
MSSANIMQACVASNVGTQSARVITYAKNLRHVSPPYITQAMLKDGANMVGADRKSLRLGTMDYYIHILSAKGVYFLCLTEGSAITNPAATYGFLDQVMKNFEPSNYEGMSSKQDSDMRRLISKWNDPNVMVTAKLKNQLADITAKASKTVDALLTREKNLDNLLQKSDDLAQKAEEVRKVAEEVYWAMVWRVWKWQIIYFCGFLLLVLIIVAAVCGSGSC